MTINHASAKMSTAAMGYLLCRAVLILVCCANTPITLAQFATPYNPPKVWWTKRITPDFFTAGRLSERQIKYAAEAGFKSIVSVFDTNAPAWIGHEYLPSTSEIQQMANDLVKVRFHVLDVVDDKLDLKSIDEFANVEEGLPKPVLVFCNDTYTSTFIVLLHLARSKKLAPKDGEQSKEFYRIGNAMGHQFDSDASVVHLVSTATGESPVSIVTKSPGELAKWREYWPAKFVSPTFFDAGQVWRSHIPMIKSAGFGAVINMRQGKTSIISGQPSQEEVTLLNIPAGTQPYFKGNRQFILRLLETRIDPNKSKGYISPNSPWNVELQNENEFGDEVGYNEELERQAFREAGIPYYHIPAPYPCGTDCIRIFHTQRDKIAEIAKQYGRVLMHCKIGYRTGFFSLLMEAYVSCRDYDWLMGQAHIMGYDFDSDYTRSDDVALQQSLQLPRPQCEQVSD
ncbi:uncharacterized protein [Ptychodera flava]|uniref:uncharacterized protein n=1 Tax=Ptychodera flava TaxID=63121 RepID=UPI00396A0231